MRVLIMADMEGVSGIVVWEQTRGGDPMFMECRKLYTEEINSRCARRGRAGATEIVAVDRHGVGGGWTFNSFVPELLTPPVIGWRITPGRVTRSCWKRAATPRLMIGMHARAGTPDGVLRHTISTVTWRNLWFGDDLVGEIWASTPRPVVTMAVRWLLVTGDEAVCSRKPPENPR